MIIDLFMFHLLAARAHQRGELSSIRNWMASEQRGCRKVSLYIHIYMSLANELVINTPEEQGEEHKSAEEAAADPAYDGMASAMKQDEDSLASCR